MIKLTLSSLLFITHLVSSFTSQSYRTHHIHLQMTSDDKYHFAIDRGGTFTDIHCHLPSGEEIVSKLLSVDPTNYADAPTEGIRRILDQYEGNYPRGVPVKTGVIGSIRMGTTVATNALLEREGERTGLVTTRGFGDLLMIGDQTRPNIFDLTCGDR